MHFNCLFIEPVYEYAEEILDKEQSSKDETKEEQMENGTITH